MKKLIFVLILFASCDKKEGYQCACNEVNNPIAQRYFEGLSGTDTRENAERKCNDREADLKQTYIDSPMQASYLDTTKVPIKDVVCSLSFGHSGQ